VWGPGQRKPINYGFMKPASEAAGLRCYVDPVSNTHNRFPLIDVLSVLANDYRATVVQALHGVVEAATPQPGRLAKAVGLRVARCSPWRANKGP